MEFYLVINLGLTDCKKKKKKKKIYFVAGYQFVLQQKPLTKGFSCDQLQLKTTLNNPECWINGKKQFTKISK